MEEKFFHFLNANIVLSGIALPFLEVWRKDRLRPSQSKGNYNDNYLYFCLFTPIKLAFSIACSTSFFGSLVYVF